MKNTKRIEELSEELKHLINEWKNAEDERQFYADNKWSLVKIIFVEIFKKMKFFNIEKKKTRYISA